MARLAHIEPQKAHRVPEVGDDTQALARLARVEELRRLVQRGAYKVNPQRLALRILVKALHNE